MKLINEIEYSTAKDLEFIYPKEILNYLNANSTEDIIIIHGLNNQEEIYSVDDYIEIDKILNKVIKFWGYFGFGKFINKDIKVVINQNASPIGIIINKNDLDKVIDKPLKLFLDDIRTPKELYPDNFDEWLKFSKINQLMKVFKNNHERVDEISLDWNLTESYDYAHITGMNALLDIIDFIEQNKLDINNLKINMHSSDEYNANLMKEVWEDFRSDYLKS
ncbi:MAG: hypothetical protein [Bacteriophage sp.]|nr:MAG: hypothetical protein [Bacteriophage sp.]